MLGFFMPKLNIYDFVDKKKLDAVKKPIAQSNGLPNECYISKEYMSFERKKLFEDMWTVIGVASSIPNIGDAKPFNLQNRSFPSHRLQMLSFLVRLLCDVFYYIFNNCIAKT